MCAMRAVNFPVTEAIFGASRLSRLCTLMEWLWVPNTVVRASGAASRGVTEYGHKRVTSVCSNEIRLELLRKVKAIVVG